MKIEICKHCGKNIWQYWGDKECDHIHYPEGCDVCRKGNVTTKFEKDELKVWILYIEDHLLDLLNGETTLSEEIENLASFRNSEHYTGSNEDYKKSA